MPKQMSIDDFGHFLRKMRMERGLSLNQFAKASGISSAYVSLIERCLKPPPSEEVIKKMADVLEIKVDILKGYDQRTIAKRRLQSAIESPPEWLIHFLNKLDDNLNETSEYLDPKFIEELVLEIRKERCPQQLEAITLHFTPAFSEFDSSIYLYRTEDGWICSPIKPSSMRGLNKRSEYRNASRKGDSQAAGKGVSDPKEHFDEQQDEKTKS